MIKIVDNLSGTEGSFKSNWPKYYSAAFTDNAAKVLISGNLEVAAIEAPGGPLVKYNNLGDVENLIQMNNDPLLSGKIKKAVLDIESSLDGMHVVRTRDSLNERQMRKFLSKVHDSLNSKFYIHSKKREGVVQDCLILYDLYGVPIS